MNTPKHQLAALRNSEKMREQPATCRNGQCTGPARFLRLTDDLHVMLAGTRPRLSSVGVEQTPEAASRCDGMNRLGAFRGRHGRSQLPFTPGLRMAAPLRMKSLPPVRSHRTAGWFRAHTERQRLGGVSQLKEPATLASPIKAAAISKMVQPLCRASPISSECVVLG